MAFCKTCGAETRAPAESVITEPVITEPGVTPPGVVPPLPDRERSASGVFGRLAAGGGLFGGRRLVWISRGFLVLALLGTGVLVGWAMGSDESLVEAESPAAVADDVGDESTSDLDAPTMPDVRGLSALDARQILADVGIAASVVSTTDQPAAGESGIVLSQDPVYGYPVDANITLAVSTPAKVPEFEGRSADDVLADLDELGAEVETQSVYVPEVPVGQVASIEPEPGTLLPVAVTVVIAAEPDELLLSDVVAVEDNCYSGDTDSIAGTTFNNLISCSAYEESETSSWVIKRAAYRLTGTVGILDSGEPTERVQVEVIGDGRVLQTVPVAYGESVRINADISGVLRLSLRYRSLTKDYGTVGFGRLTLLGDAALLKTLDRY
jgi:hypothetical protein